MVGSTSVHGCSCGAFGALAADASLCVLWGMDAAAAAPASHKGAAALHSLLPRRITHLERVSCWEVDQLAHQHARAALCVLQEQHPASGM